MSKPSLRDKDNSRGEVPESGDGRALIRNAGSAPALNVCEEGPPPQRCPRKGHRNPQALTVLRPFWQPVSPQPGQALALPLGVQPRGLLPWLKRGPWATHTPRTWGTRVSNPEGSGPIHPPHGILFRTVALRATAGKQF